MFRLYAAGQGCRDGRRDRRHEEARGRGQVGGVLANVVAQPECSKVRHVQKQKGMGGGRGIISGGAKLPSPKAKVTNLVTNF